MKNSLVIYIYLFFSHFLVLDIAKSQPQPQLLFSLPLPIDASFGSPLLTGSVVSDINNDGTVLPCKMKIL